MLELVLELEWLIEAVEQRVRVMKGLNDMGAEPETEMVGVWLGDPLSEDFADAIILFCADEVPMLGVRPGLAVPTVALHEGLTVTPGDWEALPRLEGVPRIWLTLTTPVELCRAEGLSPLALAWPLWLPERVDVPETLPLPVGLCTTVPVVSALADPILVPLADSCGVALSVWSKDPVVLGEPELLCAAVGL